MMRGNVKDKVLINLLMAGIVLQCFALVRLQDKGIPLLFFVCALIFVLNFKAIVRIDKKAAAVIVIVNVWFLISMAANRYFNPMKIIRTDMIIFICLVIFYYLKILKNKNLLQSFFNIFVVYSLILFIYGVYATFADIFNLPRFLNVFINNPSYGGLEAGSRPLFFSYLGWVDKPRLYATFTEPSIYSIYVICSIVLFWIYREHSKVNRGLFIGLALMNVYYTYSRVGFSCLMFIIGFYIVIMFIDKYSHKLGNAAVYAVFVLLPFFNIFAMYIAKTFIYKDMSASLRAFSADFYMRKSLASPLNFIFGHGFGSIITDFANKYKALNIEGLESFAHNGYIEFLYELGIVGLIMFFIIFYVMTKKLSMQSKCIFLILVCSILSFEQLLNVESISAILTIIYFFLSKEEKRLNQV